MKARPKSFIQIAADQGPVMGLIFCTVFFAAIYSLRYPVMSLVTLAGLIAVPVTVWLMMTKTWRKSLGTMPFTTLWTQGIVAFGCGAMILAAASYTYFKWIEPDLLINALQSQADRWEAAGTDQSVANARALRLMIDGGALPHPSEIAFQLLCLTVFTGSMLSMLLAFITRLKKIK